METQPTNASSESKENSEPTSESAPSEKPSPISEQTAQGIGSLLTKMAEQMKEQKEKFNFYSGYGAEEGTLPIEVKDIVMREQYPLDNNESLNRAKPGDLVAVRLAGEEGTHLGIYLGGARHRLYAKFEKATGILELMNAGDNPAMFVFELGRVVYGFQSWWKKIESIDQFKQITNQDIEGTWYVQMLKHMESKREEKDKNPGETEGGQQP